MKFDAETRFEPAAWLVLFHKRSTRPWLDRILPGKYKHVSAIGFCAETQLWIFYDVTLPRTVVRALPDGEAAIKLVARHMVGKDVLRVQVCRDGVRGWRLGFWCTIGIKHLVGVNSSALRPTRLWADLLAHGATIVHHGFTIAPTSAAISRRDCGAAACTTRARRNDDGISCAPDQPAIPPVWRPQSVRDVIDGNRAGARTYQSAERPRRRGA